MTPEEFARAMAQAEKTIETARRRLMTRIVLTVERRAKKRTPVRTGALRRSIHHRVERQGVVGRVGTNLNYARVVHRRTPYLQRGLEDAQDDIQRLLSEAGKELLKAMVE